MAGIETPFDGIAESAIIVSRAVPYSGMEPYEHVPDIALRRWQEAGHDVDAAPVDLPVNAPRMEARLRLAEWLITADIARIREQNPEAHGQVVELASGLTMRGLMMTQADSALRYTELDLPVMMDLKRGVINEMLEGGLVPPVRNKLRLLAGSATNPQAIFDVEQHLSDDEEVVVTSEGVLHYLTHAEKHQFMANVTRLLVRRGGVWYTDIPSWEGIARADSVTAQATSAKTGRSVPANRYKDNADARDDFFRHGFEVKAFYSYVDPRLWNAMQSPSHPDINVSYEEFYAENHPWGLYAVGLRGQAWEPNPRYLPTTIFAAER